MITDFISVVSDTDEGRNKGRFEGRRVKSKMTAGSKRWGEPRKDKTSSSAPGGNRLFIRPYSPTMRMIISISELSATQVACERNKDSFRSRPEETMRYNVIQVQRTPSECSCIGTRRSGEEETRPKLFHGQSRQNQKLAG